MSPVPDRPVIVEGLAPIFKNKSGEEIVRMRTGDTTHIFTNNI
jgi:hypothetical protein